MRKLLQEKVEYSIDVIRRWRSEADRWGGYICCYSGGKDSEVLLELFKESGVVFRAEYNVTTNDSPENVRFIRKYHPEVLFVHPKRTFLELIEDNNMLPMTNKRFCCRKLKEGGQHGFCGVGVRREESSKRADYLECSFKNWNGKEREEYRPEKMRVNRKVIVAPILDWTEADVWEFIEERGLGVNPCYETYGRVGCMFCPYLSEKTLRYNAGRYPKYRDLLFRSIQRILDKGYMKEHQPLTPEEVFEWWISKKTVEKWFSDKKQTRLL